MPTKPIGVVRAAAADIPAAISFTVETDGSLPSGQALGEAIRQVDEKTGGVAPPVALGPLWIPQPDS